MLSYVSPNIYSVKYTYIVELRDLSNCLSHFFFSFYCLFHSPSCLDCERIIFFPLRRSLQENSLKMEGLLIWKVWFAFFFLILFFQSIVLRLILRFIRYMQDVLDFTRSSQKKYSALILVEIVSVCNFFFFLLHMTYRYLFHDILALQC